MITISGLSSVLEDVLEIFLALAEHIREDEAQKSGKFAEVVLSGSTREEQSELGRNFHEGRVAQGGTILESMSFIINANLSRSA